MMLGGGILVSIILLGTFALLSTAVVGVGVWLYRQNNSNKGSRMEGWQASGSIEDRPLEILRERYARGEISRDEFEKARKDLAQ